MSICILYIVELYQISEMVEISTFYEKQRILSFSVKNSFTEIPMNFQLLNKS